MLLKTQPRSVSPHTGCCRQLNAQNTDVVPNTVANAFELNEQELVVSGILFSISLYHYVLGVQYEYESFRDFTGCRSLQVTRQG